MTEGGGVEIRREVLTSPVATRLIEALNRELAAQYPEPGATHFRLDAGEVAQGRGGFFVAYDRGRPVGCGAIRLLDEETVEIKRMFVVEDARGRGMGRSLLARLESEGRALGARDVVLETGIRQIEAIALYRTAGYLDTEPFGEYVDSPLSICFRKNLVARGRSTRRP